MAKEETKRRNTKILQFWCVPINRAKVRENVAGELKKKRREEYLVQLCSDPNREFNNGWWEILGPPPPSPHGLVERNDWIQYHNIKWRIQMQQLKNKNLKRKYEYLYPCKGTIAFKCPQPPQVHLRESCSMSILLWQKIYNKIRTTSFHLKDRYKNCSLQKRIYSTNWLVFSISISLNLLLLIRHVNADVGLKEIHLSKAVKMFVVVDPAYTNSYEVVCSSCGVALANIVENEKCSSCAKDTINREDWVLPYNENDYYINTNAAPTTTVFILRRMSSLAQLISNAQYYQDSLNNIENATK